MPNKIKVKAPYAHKLEAIRKGRDQSVADVAKQIGVDYMRVWRIFRGELYPGHGTAERLAGWALENRDYSGCGRIKTLSVIQAEPDKWSKILWRFPKRMHQQIRAICNQWQISQGTFLQIAVQRLLENEGALKGYEMAVKKVAKARLQQAILEAPGIQDILDCEVKWAVKIGGRGGNDAADFHKQPNPHKQMEAMNVDPTSGAVSQDIWWPDDDSEFEESAFNDLDTPGEAGGDS